MIVTPADVTSIRARHSAGAALCVGDVPLHPPWSRLGAMLTILRDHGNALHDTSALIVPLGVSSPDSMERLG